MGQSNICIRLDENLKKQFDHICNELGLTMSAAINIFVKRFVNEKGLPFALSISDYNSQTQKVIDDVENGVGISKPYTNVDELMNDLLKDDNDEV